MELQKFKKILEEDLKKYRKEKRDDYYILECFNGGIQGITLDKINKNQIYNAVSFDENKLVISFWKDLKEVKRIKRLLDKWEDNKELSDEEDDEIIKIDLDYWEQDQTFYTIKLNVTE